jgi:hypothetical protein
MRWGIWLVVLAGAIWPGRSTALPPDPLPADSADPAGPTSQAPKSPADPPAAPRFYGEYDGTCILNGDSARQARAAVIARQGKAGRRYWVVHLATGGIQTARPELRVVLQGRSEDDQTVVLSDKQGRWSGKIRQGVLRASRGGESRARFDLRRIVRRPDTVGARPPRGATVLLALQPGKKPDLGAWTNHTWPGRIDGSMRVGKGDQRSRREHGSIRLHLEFRCPLLPGQTGQGRGNSGVYLQDRYEVQILDSFGLAPADNRCGGIYKIAAPRVNASLPPGRWQSYDIEFQAARFDDAGRLEAPPRITVVHNGITIHDDLELPRPTAGAKGKNHAPTGALRLQDHGDAVEYRNIWWTEPVRPPSDDE